VHFLALIFVFKKAERFSTVKIVSEITFHVLNRVNGNLSVGTRTRWTHNLLPNCLGLGSDNVSKPPNV